MSIFCLDELTWQEVSSLDKAKTIVFLPISPIEEHGPHLPTGTDFFGACDMTKLAISIMEDQNPSLNYLLMQGLPVGCSEGAIHFPGTISLKGKTLEALVYDVCSSIARHGFLKLVVTNHHLDLTHIKYILSAIEAVKRENSIAIIETLSAIAYAEHEQEYDELLKSLVCVPQFEIHADIRETSFMLYQYPELVKSVYQNLEPVQINISEKIRQGKVYIEDMGSKDGYMGSPALASTEYGKYHLEDGAKKIADLALRLYNNQKICKISTRMKYVLDNFIK